MTRAEDRVTAALLEHIPMPDHTEQDTDDLLTRLAQLLAGRAEDDVEGVALVGALRARNVSFDVIRARAGLPKGTAHRWSRLFIAARGGPVANRAGGDAQP